MVNFFREGRLISETAIQSTNVNNKKNKEIRKEAEIILNRYRISITKKKLIENDRSLFFNDKFIIKISNILKEMPEEQRSLLITRYIENDGKTFDYIVKNTLGLSERTYYRIKSEALMYFYELYTSV